MKNRSTFCRAWRDMCEDGRAHILTMAMLFLVSLLLCGCKIEGTSVDVGEISAPLDISDGSETVDVRALFSLTGARARSEKNAHIKMTYTNNYTNVYVFGMFEKSGTQGFGVDVNPPEDAEEPPPDPAPNKEVAK